MHEKRYSVANSMANNWSFSILYSFVFLSKGFCFAILSGCAFTLLLEGTGRCLLILINVCVFPVIVKASSGPRYVVGCRSKVDKEKLTAGTRVVLDMTTLTIMRALPREVRTLNSYLTKV